MRASGPNFSSSRSGGFGSFTIIHTDHAGGGPWLSISTAVPVEIFLRVYEKWSADRGAAEMCAFSKSARGQKAVRSGSYSSSLRGAGRKMKFNICGKQRLVGQSSPSGCCDAFRQPFAFLAREYRKRGGLTQLPPCSTRSRNANCIS